MLPYGFTNDFTHRKTWRKGGIWILEDDLDIRSFLSQFLLTEGKKVLAVEIHFSLCLSLKTENSASDSGFTTSRLPYKAHGGSTLDGEGNTIYSLDVTYCHLEEAALDREVLLEILDHQKILRILFSSFKQICLFQFFCHIRVPPDLLSLDIR